MRKMRVLIVDDEPLAQETLVTLLAQDPDIEILGTCDDGFQAQAVIRSQKPDLVFLDIQMPEMNGFELLRSLDREKLPLVIFVTAYDQYAIHAFEAHALDYLSKPFRDARFHEALQRAKTQLHLKSAANLNQKLQAILAEEEHLFPSGEAGVSSSRFRKRLAVKTRGRLLLIDVADIDWIEAADYYVVLHTGPKNHLLRERLHLLESALNPETFCRIHRSTLVNIGSIKEITQGLGDDCWVVLKNDTRLKVSRTRRSNLELALKKSS